MATLDDVNASLKDLMAQSATFRAEDNGRRIEAEKKANKAEVDAELDEPRKNLKEKTQNEFRIEEMRDDGFRTFSQFMGGMATKLAGSNPHTKSALNVIFMVASAITVSGQLLRKSGAISQTEMLNKMDEDAYKKKVLERQEERNAATRGASSSPPPGAGPSAGGGGSTSGGAGGPAHTPPGGASSSARPGMHVS